MSEANIEIFLRHFEGRHTSCTSLDERAAILLEVYE